MGKRKNTITMSVTRGILLFLIPANVLLSCYSLFSWSFLRQQALDNYADSLSIAANQAQGELENLRTWLQNLFFSSNRFRMLGLSDDDTFRYVTAQEINQEVRTYLEMYPNGVAFFIRCGQDLHIPAVSTLPQNSSDIFVSDFIKTIEETAESHNIGEYFLTKLGNQWYLSLYLRQGGVYAGIVMDINSLLATLNLSSEDISSYSMEDETQTLLAGESAPGKKDLALRSPIEGTPIVLKATLPQTSVLGRFQALTTVSFVLMFLALASLAAFITYTRRQVSMPLQKLQETIRKIEAGDTDQKIDLTGEKEEIAQVYQTFNGFIDRILHLKLESYEERLARQKTELQYLRLQLRPHFFLNSMKRIYALAQEGQMKDVQEYILCLSSHYRFLIYDTTNTISLQEEMLHVQNYIQLQRIGYHLEIHCQVGMEVNPSLLQVPPLVIQSFVENSIKHAVAPGVPLQLSIKAKVVSGEDGDYLNISCGDNGPGFPKSVIDEIESSNEEFSKKHIGFNNLRHRLALIYRRESFIYVYNQPGGGAMVDVLIPVETPDALPERRGS